MTNYFQNAGSSIDNGINGLTGLFDTSNNDSNPFDSATDASAFKGSENSSIPSGSSSGSGQSFGDASAWGLPLQALNTGFGIYSGLKQLGLANKEFKLNRAIATGNFNNNVKQYNTNLQTASNLRSSMEGTGGPGSTASNDYYNQNKLSGV